MPTNLEHSHNLLDLFSNKFGVEIVLQSSKSDFVGAYILRFADRIEILVRGGNTCWTRFFVCKELSQMLLHKPENTTSTTEDAQELISNLACEVWDKDNIQVVADKAAEFAAIEFLLPSVVADKLLKLRRRFSNMQFAKKMLIPEKIIDWRLSEKGQEYFQD